MKTLADIQRMNRAKWPDARSRDERAKTVGVDAGGVRIVYNKLLGGWYIVRGPAQTPIGGRFESKEAAEAHLNRSRDDSTAAVGQTGHLGFGAKGGAGFNGKITKIEGERIHIVNPEGRTYYGQLRFWTPD